MTREDQEIEAAESEAQDRTAAPSGYRVRRIVNGWLMSHPDGRETFFKDISNLGDWIKRQLEEAHEQRRHFKWDGQWELIFAHTLTTDNAERSSSEETKQ